MYISGQKYYVEIESTFLCSKVSRGPELIVFLINVSTSLNKPLDDRNAVGRSRLGTHRETDERCEGCMGESFSGESSLHRLDANLMKYCLFTIVGLIYAIVLLRDQLLQHTILARVNEELCGLI